MARDVALEDILLGNVKKSSSEDDVPIVATLSNISTTTVKKKRKKKKQSLWTYVQVAEPTGVASNYWDAEAPPERHTKRVAKKRLSESKEVISNTTENSMTSLSQKAQICPIGKEWPANTIQDNLL